MGLALKRPASWAEGFGCVRDASGNRQDRASARQGRDNDGVGSVARAYTESVHALILTAAFVLPLALVAFWLRAIPRVERQARRPARARGRKLRR